MSEEVQMSIKIESDLRERFMAVAADRHRLAAQIIRDLMRLYIADSETPNALTMVSLSIIKLDQRSIKLGDRTQQLSTSERTDQAFFKALFALRIDGLNHPIDSRFDCATM